VELRSSAEVRAFLEKAFLESRAARDLAGYEQAYKLLGLVPPSLDVRKILLDLLEEQVVGFYDPKTKALYVVRSTKPEALDVTVSHELVHALQDQYANLDSIQNADVDNDRATAAQAAIEGHATYVSILDAPGAREIAAMPDGWGTIADQIRNESAQAEGIGAAPAAIRESLIFPYAGGLPFVGGAFAAHPGMSLVTDPPRSTEQILHRAAYRSPRDEPTTVVLPPLGGGVAVEYENTLGEFETRLVLAEHLRDTAVAARAAAGWDGDRYAVVRTAAGLGIVWASVWDTPADGEEFRQELAVAIARRYGAAPDAVARGRTVAAGRAVEIGRADVAGRPVVLFSDLPADAPPLALDPAGVTLREK
jgi:hypothetical protein